MSANSSKKQRRTWRDWLAVVGYVGWTGGAAMVAMYGISQYVIKPLLEANILSASWMLDTAPGTLTMIAVQYIVALIAVLILPLLIQRRDVAYMRTLIGLQYRPRLRDVGLALIGWSAYFLMAIPMILLTTTLFQGFDVNQMQPIGFSTSVSGTELVIAFIGLVVVAPLAEELLFRGYLFGSLRRHTGFIVTALLTSVLFGLAHGQWNVGIDVFFLSLVLCYLREKTNSVWAGVVLHALKNLIAFIFLFVFKMVG